MALARKIKNLYLDKAHPNAPYPEPLLQGSLDKIFNVTLLDDNVEETIGDSAEVTVIVLYNPRMEYDKFVKDGSYVLNKDTTGWDVTIANGKISIPFHDGMVTYAGKNQLVLLIKDGFTTYSYQMDFEVARNNAYTEQSLPDNLPSYKNLQKQIQDLTAQSNSHQQEIQNLQTTVAGKADDDLGNVGDFSTIPDGGVIIKKDGTIKNSGISILGDQIQATDKILNVKELKTAPNTISIGEAIKLKENGGALEIETQTVGKRWLVLDYENDPINGSKKPVYMARAAKEQVTIQNVNTSNMVLSGPIDFGRPQFDRQIQSMYLDFITEVKNLRMKISVNNKDLFFYPSKRAYDGIDKGLDMQVGMNKIDLIPNFTNVTEYNSVITFVADGPVNVKGNGNLPWYKLDLNRITRHNVLIDGDSGSESPEELARALEALAEDKKLSYSTGLKDKPTIPTKSENLTDMPQDLTGMQNKILSVKTDESGYELIDVQSGGTSPDLKDYLKKNLDGVDLIALKSEGTKSGLADEDNVTANTKELNRINAIMNQHIFSGSFKGDLTNVVDDTKAYKGYFLTVFNVDDNNNTVSLPDHADIQVGTIFTLDNQDFNSSIKIQAPQDALIDGSTSSLNVPSENIVFLIRDNDKWATGFSGALPASIARIIADVKIAYPNIGQGGGLTIDQIEEKLKDKLKTTSQIAQEFKDQLHTIPQLIDEGMMNQHAEYFFGDTYLSLFPDFKVDGIAIMDHTTTVTSPNNTSYLALRIPEWISVLIKEVWINNVAQKNPDITEGSWGNKDYYFWSFNTPIAANSQVEIHFAFIDQLNDKLHTFDEIDTEIKSRGFFKQTCYYGFTGDLSFPANNSWIDEDNTFIAGADSTTITVTPDDQSILIAVPSVISSLVHHAVIQGTEYTLNSKEIIYKGEQFTLFQTLDKFTQGNRNLHLMFKIEFPKDEGVSITGDDPTELSLGIKDLVFPTSIAKLDSLDKEKVEIKPYVNVKVPITQTEVPGTQYQDFKSTDIKFLSPIQGFSDPDKELGSIVEISHNAYEKQHNNGFLAYMSHPVSIMGKNSDPGKYHKGALFPENIIIEADGRGIQRDAAKRTLGVQEYDGKDPNISGGTDFLICARVSLEGKANTGGFIRVMLANADLNPLDEDTVYLKDVNDDIVASEKSYEAGDELGYIDLMGMVNATGLKEFKLIVITDMAQDIYTTEKYKGLTGIMIQSMSSTEKSGLALTQYELDTRQDIRYSALFLGDYLKTLQYALSELELQTQVVAGDFYEELHDVSVYAVATTTVGVIDANSAVPDFPNRKTRALEAEGSDFNVRSFFNSDVTRLLHNKDIQVTFNIQNQQSDYYMALMVWKGVPDEYTKEIYKSRSGAALNLETNWVEADKKLINVNASAAFRDETETFNVPADATNLAVVIYPSLGSGSASLRVHNLTVNVSNPFNGYVLHTSKPDTERHLEFDDEYKRVVNGTNGYPHGLRYTNTNVESPMPVGIPIEGGADITLDNTVDTPTGTKGEGALKFGREGKAVIKTQLRLWSDEPKNTATTVRFWYGKLHADGKSYDKIVDSESSFIVGGGAQNVLYSMKEFSIDLKANDRLVLRSEDQKANGSYIACISDDKPMVDTKINFEEITSEYYVQSKTKVLEDNLKQLFKDDDFTRYRDSMKFSIDMVMPNSSTTLDIDFTGIDNDSFPRIVEIFKKDGSGNPVMLPNVTQKYTVSTKVMSIAFGDTINKDEEIIIFGEVWVQ